jgi:hypothetical protein
MTCQGIHVHEATGTAMGVSEMGKCIKQTVGRGHGTKEGVDPILMSRRTCAHHVFGGMPPDSEELTRAGPNVVFFHQ